MVPGNFAYQRPPLTLVDLLDCGVLWVAGEA
jgi:hypothetical protein